LSKKPGKKWDTSEGGALPGADGPVEITITDAEFNYDASYNNGDSLVFILSGDCDHEYWQGTVIYSIGDGWDTEDNVIAEGKDMFGRNTRYARFFNAVLATKAADIVIERAEESGEGPADASIYHGLVFKFERQSYMQTFSGEETEKFILLPTKFVGEAGGKGKSKGKSKGKKSKTLDKKELRAAIKKLAKKHDDHDDFVEAVLVKYPEVEDHSKLYDDVLEEGVFVG